MDTIVNFRTFIAVAQAGSFSKAARQLGIAASVVTKRIDQLEWRARTRLFERSTRRLALTDEGQRLLPVARRIVHDVEDAFGSALGHAHELEGHLRIKVPTSLTATCLGDALGRFLEVHPKLSMDVVVIDRPVNPIQEGFDIVVGMLPASYDGVLEAGLCPLPRMAVAAPSYLAARGRPAHPTDLARHALLNFQPTGPVWTFQGPNGPIAVEVTPRLSTNDGHVLLNSVLRGNGITILSAYIVDGALGRGELVRVLEDFAIPEYWIRALVPHSRAHLGRVQALLSWLRNEFTPLPPWARHESCGLPASS
ncbi:LysR family transcriptional regulator [Pigmentiphaga kullae]|uniref:DNA-binding transcriptional LysR family regulator n=1 Tax=Pigmentiphaga kullae TaxID=151784 RepID=A0A4V2F2W5_9BURK|nr:LysR family transcriptional regulator [Pigmentiphaga kullae]RZS80314.1 DNA-binding transcriptional LysR family regulator [Pigmentiphaga kullae]